MTNFLWTQRANFGPSPRSASGVTFDSKRGRAVLFGGSNTALLSDTWEWDGSLWTQMQDIGPAPRNANGAIAFDSARQASVLFGGANLAAGVIVPLGDTWRWDGAEWTQVSDSGPSARLQHAVAFDSGRNHLVLFGGRDAAAHETIFSDTWEFDGETWTQHQDAGPSPRYGHATAYDGKGRVVLFGGLGQNELPLGDTWAWNGQAWAQIAEFGPPARYFAAMAGGGGNLILYGGQSSTQATTPAASDTWAFDGKLWTKRQDIGPGPLLNAAMAFDSARGAVVLFGGINALGSSTFSGATWEAAFAAPAKASVA